MIDAAAITIDAESLADFTLALVAEPSLSGCEGGVAELVQREMERLGFDVEIDELGSVTGTLAAGPGPCILVDSHMDTVGVSDPGAWSRRPDGERVADRIYGRGTVDMKGPLAASIYGIAALRSRLERGRVVVSASVAEELVEGLATVVVAERVRPDVVVICEATGLRVARGQRGRAEVQIEVHGRAAHSSRPDLPRNLRPPHAPGGV
jgi:acetylornithine deacetylase/succinyl-diaminopimelate desuccinylase-like protein